MQEVDYAIEILKKCSLEYASSLEEVKAIHLAIDTLKEKQQREQESDYKTIAKGNHSKWTAAYVEILKLERDIERLKTTNEALENDFINANLNLERVAAELEQKWIPVSKRLPENIGETVLLTVASDKGISHGYGSIDIAYFRNDISKLFHGADGIYKYDEVKAWMPLPEPYKEESYE